VLYGEPALLSSITAPADLQAGSDVTIAAKVVTPVCHKSCIFETQEVSLRLPVVADATAVNPANKELFAEAAKEIPPEDGKGRYVTVTAEPSVDTVAVGGSMDVVVTIDVKPGFKVQSNKPYVAGFIPTEVVVEPVAGVELGDFVYPKAKERVDRTLKMKLSEFAGRVDVKVPVAAVTDDAAGDSLTLRGIVISQACAEGSGRCFAPEAVAWSTTVALTGAKAVASATPSGQDQAEEPAFAATADEDGEAGSESMTLPVVLLFAFLGGIILNVMPCVWPVLSIKVLSFVQQAHDDPKRTLRLGLLFGLGILASFWLLGAAAVVAKTAAGGATWGTQFSHPTFVIAMIAVLYVFGLSLFGVFEINLPGAASGKLSAASAKEGYLGSYMKGMLATVLATPCTAPLLGPAIFAAFSQTAAVIMAAMTAIGLGMAAPYVVLAARPSWLGFLPKPGPWMDTFKQFTGFLMMGVVVWLLWVLGDLMGASGLVSTATFLTALGLACWFYGKIGMNWSLSGRLVGSMAVLAIAFVGGWFSYGYVYTPSEDTEQFVSAEGPPPLPTESDWDGKIPWVRHRQGLDEQLAAQGHTVFINYTATWCTKCQVQKKTVLETEEVRAKMRDLGVIPLKADFTRRPKWLVEELKQRGTVGVPWNVIVPAGKPDQPIILPLSLSASVLQEKLEEAGPSRATTGTPVASAQLR
jgi:thiol:disulfide interchange protein DsbD